MKKIRKSILVCTLVLALLAGFCVPAMAVQTDRQDQIDVLLNDSVIDFTDATPYILSDRTFVPFRAVFEALGAEVSFDGETQTVTAVRGDTTVVFTIGQTSIDVTANGVTETVEADVAPFIDAAYSRTMVPVRFAAQALDCTVGWDSAARTVLIFDVDGLLNGEEFTLMDKIAAYSETLLSAGCAVFGTFDMSLKISEDGTLIPVVANGTVSGLYGSDAVNMDLQMTIDLSDLLEAYDVEIDAETQQMVEQFQNITVEYILNLEEGMMYIKSPLLSTFLGIDIEGDYWISIDLSSYTSELNEASLISQETGSFEEEVRTALPSIPLTNISDLEETMQAFEIIRSLFADSSFAQDGDTYTSTYTYSDEYGVDANAELRITMQGDDITGFQFTLNTGDSVGTAVYLLFAMDQSKDVTLQITMSESDIFEMELNLALDFSNTTREPDNAPPDGSVIIPLE